MFNFFNKEPEEEKKEIMPIEERTFRLSRSSISSEPVDILDSYPVQEASVTITGDGKYIVKEPPFSETASEMYSVVLEKINSAISLDIVNDTQEERIQKFLKAFYDVALQIYPIDDVTTLFPQLEYYVKRDLAGYQILDVLMNDKLIEDITAIPDGRVFITHKKFSKNFDTMETNVMFSGRDDMEQFIAREFGRTGSEPTKANPIAKTEMRDGSRISCNIGDDISHGVNIAIRKFSDTPFTITHMMKTGTITPEMCAYLWTLLDAKAVGLVIGVTGSGKTTLMGSLITLLNPFWRILTIEDTYELVVPHENCIPLRTRKTAGMIGEEYNITVRKLIDMSLTQRPDFEIIGEVRTDDMDMLFQAVGTGHGGLCLPGNEKIPIKHNGTFMIKTMKDVIDILRDKNDDIIQVYTRNSEKKCEWIAINNGIVKTGNMNFLKFMTNHSEFSTHEDHPITVLRNGNEETILAKEVNENDFVPRPGKITVNDNVLTKINIVSWLPEKHERIIVAGNGKSAKEFMNAGIEFTDEMRIRAWGGRKPAIPALLPMGKEMGSILAWCALGKPLDITKDIVKLLNNIGIESVLRRSGSIRIHSELFQWFLQKINIRNNGFPEVLLNASLECRMAALDIFKKYSDRAVSKNIAQNICILAATCGISTNIKIEGTGELDHFVTIIENEKSENTVIWDPIQNITQYKSRSSLYDIMVPKNANFCHGSGAFTHNTSFHAANAEGAIARLRGEKIQDGSLGLLWVIVQCNRLNLGGTSKRKVMGISEVTNRDEDGKVETNLIYKYNIFTDKFDCLVENVFETKKYREAQELVGIKDPEADFKKRIRLLQECIEEDANTPKDVFNILKRYHLGED